MLNIKIWVFVISLIIAFVLGGIGAEIIFGMGTLKQGVITNTGRNKGY